MSLKPQHTSENTTRNTHETNSYTEPNLQFLVLTNKQDQIVKLLEATKHMTKYFKRFLKHLLIHTANNVHYQNNISTSHSNKQKHKTHYHKDEVSKIHNGYL